MEKEAELTSLFITLLRLLRALTKAMRDSEFRNLALILVLLIASGTFFYSIVEGWRAIDALYFTIITLSTVGYGDLSPQTDIGKIFTIIYIFSGIGLFVAVVSHIAFHETHRRKKSKPHGRHDGSQLAGSGKNEKEK